jgi:hypothetical protein
MTTHHCRASSSVRPLSSSEITFERPGYADAAKASYAVFSQLKQTGLIPAGTRFQVSLPTPLAPVFAFIVTGDQVVVEPAYEAAMLAELDLIAAAIPHHELAIQWDIAVEFGILESAMPTAFEDAKKMVVERLERLANRVPATSPTIYYSPNCARRLAPQPASS